MEHSQEIGPNVILSVVNPQNAATVRVNIEKHELDDQNSMQPVKNKKISLNAVQYASLKQVHQAILDEIYYRQRNPNKYGHEMKMHLGGTVFASMNKEYDLVSLRNHYFPDTVKSPVRPKELKLQKSYNSEAMDLSDGDDADKTLKIEESYDTCDYESTMRAGAKRKSNGQLPPAKRIKTETQSTSNFQTCESKDSKSVKSSLFDTSDTKPAWSVADAVPGVPGISLRFKTMQYLCTQFDNLDEMFRTLDEAMPCSHTDRQAELSCHMCTPVDY